ncbi:hypothetical protein OF83DRAFT_1081613 [Amylostereum chailletii]|nr:hypothetical protein OF83DRAFT_1081613 [Amylostereum chailletii]
MEKSRPGRVPANQARVPAIPSQQHQRAFLPPALAPTRSDRIPSHVAPSSGPVSGSQKSGPHGERKKFKGKQREDAAGVHRDEDKLMGAFISTMLDVGGKDGLHATSTADGMFGALQGTLGKGG